MGASGSIGQGDSSYKKMEDPEKDAEDGDDGVEGDEPRVYTTECLLHLLQAHEHVNLSELAHLVADEKESDGKVNPDRMVQRAVDLAKAAESESDESIQTLRKKLIGQFNRSFDIQLNRRRNRVKVAQDQIEQVVDSAIRIRLIDSKFSQVQDERGTLSLAKHMLASDPSRIEAIHKMSEAVYTFHQLCGEDAPVDFIFRTKDILPEWVLRIREKHWLLEWCLPGPNRTFWLPVAAYFNFFRLRVTYICIVAMVLSFSAFAGVLIESFMSQFTELNRFFSIVGSPSKDPPGDTGFHFTYNLVYFMLLPLFVMLFAFFTEGIIELAMDSMKSPPCPEFQASLLQGLKWMTHARALIIIYWISVAVPIGMLTKRDHSWSGPLERLGLQSFILAVGVGVLAWGFSANFERFMHYVSHSVEAAKSHKIYSTLRRGANVVYVLCGIVAVAYPSPLLAFLMLLAVLPVCFFLRNRSDQMWEDEHSRRFRWSVEASPTESKNSQADKKAEMLKMFEGFGRMNEKFFTCEFEDTNDGKKWSGRGEFNEHDPIVCPITHKPISGSSEDEKAMTAQQSVDPPHPYLQDLLDACADKKWKEEHFNVEITKWRMEELMAEFHSPERWARKVVDWIMLFLFEFNMFGGGLYGLWVHSSDPDGRSHMSAFLQSVLWSGVMSVFMAVVMMQISRLISALDCYFGKTLYKKSRWKRSAFATKRPDIVLTWTRMFTRLKCVPYSLSHLSETVFAAPEDPEPIRETGLQEYLAGKPKLVKQLTHVRTARKSVGPLRLASGWLQKHVQLPFGLVVFDPNGVSVAASAHAWLTGFGVFGAASLLQLIQTGWPFCDTNKCDVSNDTMYYAFLAVALLLILWTVGWWFLLSFILRKAKRETWAPAMPVVLSWIFWFVCVIVLFRILSNERANEAHVPVEHQKLVRNLVVAALCPMFLVVAWVSSFSFAKVVPHTVGRPFWIINFLFCIVFATLLMSAMVDLPSFGAAVMAEGECGEKDNCHQQKTFKSYQMPLCTQTWGHEGANTQVTALDLALIAGLSYEEYCEDMGKKLLQIFPGGKSKRIAKIQHCDDYDQFPRTLVVDIGPESAYTRVIAFKGTSTMEDIYRDATFWSGVKVLQWFGIILPVLDLFAVSQVQWFLDRFHLFGQIECEERFWRNVTTEIKTTWMDKESANKQSTVFTGHSLGGAVGQIVAARLNRPALTFSGVGVGYSTQRFGISKRADWLDFARNVGAQNYSVDYSQLPYTKKLTKGEDFGIQALKTKVVNVIPSFDAVPRIDSQLAMVMPIECRESGLKAGNSSSSFSCHSLNRTACEVLRMCGDIHNRKFACWEDRSTQMTPGRFAPYYVPDDVY